MSEWLFVVLSWLIRLLGFIRFRFAYPGGEVPFLKGKHWGTTVEPIGNKRFRGGYMYCPTCRECFFVVYKGREVSFVLITPFEAVTDERTDEAIQDPFLAEV